MRSVRVRRSVSISALAAIGAVVSAAEPAAAHVGSPGAGALDGLLHPVTGPDHLLAMVAVGVVGVLLARGRTWCAPAAFVGGMTVGGIAGIAGVPLPGAEPLIIASVILLGIAIAAAIDGAGGWLFVAVAAAGLAHGHAHGAEAPTSAHPIVYIAAFVVASAALHAIGSLVGRAIYGRAAARVGLGAATAATGVLLLTA